MLHLGVVAWLTHFCLHILFPILGVAGSVESIEAADLASVFQTQAYKDMLRVLHYFASKKVSSVIDCRKGPLLTC